MEELERLIERGNYWYGGWGLDYAHERFLEEVKGIEKKYTLRDIVKTAQKKLRDRHQNPDMASQSRH